MKNHKVIRLRDKGAASYKRRHLDTVYFAGNNHAFSSNATAIGKQEHPYGGGNGCREENQHGGKRKRIYLDEIGVTDSPKKDEKNAKISKDTVSNLWQWLWLPTTKTTNHKKITESPKTSIRDFASRRTLKQRSFKSGGLLEMHGDTLLKKMRLYAQSFPCYYGENQQNATETSSLIARHVESYICGDEKQKAQIKKYQTGGDLENIWLMVQRKLLPFTLHKYTDKDFNSAYKKAKEDEVKQFRWNGKVYNTDYEYKQKYMEEAPVMEADTFSEAYKKALRANVPFFNFNEKSYCATDMNDKKRLSLQLAEDFVLKEGIENTIKSNGYDKNLDKWTPQASVEGGAKTIGKGLKMNNKNTDWYKLYEKQGYLTNAQMEKGVAEMIALHYENAKKTYNNIYGENAWENLGPDMQAWLAEYSYNGVVGQFKNFMQGIHDNDFDKIYSEYIRTTNGKPLRTRNEEFRKWIDEVYEIHKSTNNN